MGTATTSIVRPDLLVRGVRTPNADRTPMGTAVFPDISVVIPALDAAPFLPGLLSMIDGQTLSPREIVLVDSSAGYDTEALARGWRGRTELVYHRVHPSYPGEARNAGVELARCQWVAFLDCRTIPDRSWLEQCASASQGGVDFVSARFVCAVDSRFKKTLLAATYGHLRIRSLPGSLVRRSVFQASGGFLENVRAGEDIEWMQRLAASGTGMATLESPVITYHGFPETLGEAIRKWHRYTLANARIDVLNVQKILYSTFCFLTCLLFVYRWNDLFAHWKESSIYYIPNITKTFLTLVAAGYALHRGGIRPVIRKVPLSFLLPWRWVEVMFVGLCLDIVKTPGMVLGACILIRKRFKCPAKGLATKREA